jgi:hypothetical protein
VFNKLTRPGKGKEHEKEVFHIVVGRGKHSQEKETGVLKYVVARWLDQERYEFWQDMKHGQFLVLIR